MEKETRASEIEVMRYAAPYFWKSSFICSPLFSPPERNVCQRPASSPLACRLLRRVGAAIGPEARDAPGFSREASPSRHEARAARDQRRATAQERGEDDDGPRRHGTTVRNPNRQAAPKRDSET